MRKIVLKNCDVKEFNSLIKRSASLDNYIFINIKGSRFESTAYNKNKSALKSITADLEKYCESYINELGEETVKIQFSNATKLVSALGLRPTTDAVWACHALRMCIRYDRDCATTCRSGL